MSLLIWGMIGIILFEVVARYVFNSPTNWALESASLTFGAFAIGAGAYTLLHEAHVKMDILYTHWSKRTRAVVDLCTFPLFLAFCGVLLWQSGIAGWQSVSLLERSNTAWGPPLYHWKMLVPVAAFLILLQGARGFIHNLLVAIGRQEQ